ncbi:MAG: DUF922 domain-containing Zn-dependent protease [Phycisphaerae bacterium]|nr:DUF922 domain-containing Zn-dependent protease [Phycisphaerae bacterium]
MLRRSACLIGILLVAVALLGRAPRPLIAQGGFEVPGEPIKFVGRTGTSCARIVLEFCGRPESDPTFDPNGELHLYVELECGLFAENTERNNIPGATVMKYAVTGNTRAQACADIFNNVGPRSGNRRYAGQTTLVSDIEWNAPNLDRNGRLVVRITKLTPEYEVSIPAWTFPDNLPQADRNMWNTFIAELVRHERGHVDIFRAREQAWKNQVVGQQFTIDRNATDAQINARCNQIARAAAAFVTMQMESANYDAPFNAQTNPTGTNHGTENGQNATCPDV